MSLTFYYAPMSTASITELVLEELGIPCERVKLDYQKGETKQPEYLAVNPNGKVPCIVHDGTAIWESAAADVWLGGTAWVASGGGYKIGAWVLQHWDGQTWTVVKNGTEFFHSFWGSSPTDLWAQRNDAVPALMCADAANWNALKEPPPGTNSPEWAIEQTRASEAAARAFWPLGNTRLEKRLPYITAPTLLIWGEADAIMPKSYAARFTAGMKTKPKVVTIAGAGHLAELDKPDEVAAAIVEWTN